MRELGELQKKIVASLDATVIQAVDGFDSDLGAFKKTYVCACYQSGSAYSH